MKSKIKLLIAMMFALVVVTQATPLVFPNNSPDVRPQLGTYLASKLQNLGKRGELFLASIFTRVDSNAVANYQEELKKTQDRLSNVAFKQLSQGVYAKDEGKTHSLVEVNLDQITFIEHTFMIKGKTYTIRIPKDQQPPPQNVLEQMYGN